MDLKSRQHINVIPPASSYNERLVFKALLKCCETAHKEPHNLNTIFKSPHLKTLPHISKAFYTSIIDSNKILLPDSYTNNKPFSKFILKLSAIINPLIVYTNVQ